MSWKYDTYCMVLYTLLLSSECADILTNDEGRAVTVHTETDDNLSTERDADLLQPYLYHHGPRHHHRVVRECQPVTYGPDTYEEVPAHQSSSVSPPQPVITHNNFVHKIEEYWTDLYISGHHIVVSDPDKTVSVLEPLTPGGCDKNYMGTVADTAKNRQCLVAINAGFFNTTSGECFGDVISDSRLAHSSGGVQNAHFGIETDGSLFFGYLPPEVDLMNSFTQLVGGVIWLVRNGQNYVDISKEAECSDSQETGNLQTFIDVHSARIAVGHDAKGHLVIVAIDGRTWERGLTLYQFADLLIELGVVNAINFDGGGSTTVVMNNTLVNYPGDRCNISNFMYSCEREVSTVLCIHDIPCTPADCSNHGDCHHGRCSCHGNWSGWACDILLCGGSNCSGVGECTPDGCVCGPGYQGQDCSEDCHIGYYGDDCRYVCNCSHGEMCDPVTGTCYCNPGYMGYHCESPCPYGYYGDECEGICNCLDGCSCHPITGQCHLSPSLPTVWQLGHCVADKIIVRRDLLSVDPDQYYLLLSSLVAISIIALGSIILNVIMFSCKIEKSSQLPLSPLKNKVTSTHLKSPGSVHSSSSENRPLHRQSDADGESSNDSEPKSFLSRISLGKNKKRKRALWKTWHQKFRRKKDDYKKLGQEGSASEANEKVLLCDANFIPQPLSPIICDNPGASNHLNDLNYVGKQRTTSGNTEELLDEISLELSSPERKPSKSRGQPTVAQPTSPLEGNHILLHTAETIF